MTDMTKQTEAISTERALKLALEALKSCDAAHITDGGRQWYDEKLVDKAVEAIEKALDSEAIEQPAPATELREQEPCGWQFFQDGKWHNGMETNDHRANTEAAGVPVRDVYPSPPASKPLTDEEIERCMKQAYATVQGRNLERAFARAIEAAHGIKEHT